MTKTEQSAVGDKVEIIESRPRSKSKRWELVRVVEKSTAVDLAALRAAAQQDGQEPEQSRRINGHDTARDTPAGGRQHRGERSAVHQSAGRFPAPRCRLGDIIVCSVKSVIPGSDIKKKAVVRAVIVRCKQPTRRPDGSYIRFDSNAVVIIDNEKTRAGRASSGRWPASCGNATL
jgi:hypothetical protein